MRRIWSQKLRLGRVYTLFIPVLIGLVGCGGNGTAPTAKPAVTLVAPSPTRQKSITPDATANSTDTSATRSVSPSPNSPVMSDTSGTSDPSLPTFTQLTSGGCCVQPFFSPDDSQVLFIDKPSPDAPTGIYGLPISQPLSTPTLFSSQLGPFSRDMSIAIDLVGGRTTLQRRDDDSPAWVINNGGRPVSISPDNKRVAWNISQDSGNFDVRRSEIWIANIDGSAAQRVLTRYGGGIQGWMSDSQRILVGGKANRNDPTATLSIFDLRDASLRDVYSADRMRGFNLSPNNRWLVFFIAQSRQAEQNGLYLIDLDSPGAQPVRQNWFGAFRWRDGQHLLYVPLTPGAPSSELRQLDANTGISQVLLPAAADSPFKIANGDWDVSDDGQRILFLSARDRNIWLLTVPTAPAT